MEGIRASGWVGFVVLAVLALAGCGDSDELTASNDSVAASGEADKLVASAVEEVLGDGSFRSRTTGQVPFVLDMNEVYEQSGEDAVDITISDSHGSATVISGDTAYEWDASSQSWNETPLDSFDPLVGPGSMFGMSLVGLLELADESGAEGEFDDASAAMEMPPVATGWAQLDPSADGMRRFERTMSWSMFADPVPQSEHDVPVERLEEDAITGEFYRTAQLISTVEIDSEGDLARNTVRVVFDGAPDFPDCAPLTRLVGTTELVVEFSDVGSDFTITVPEPAELIAEFPVIAETPDYSDPDSEVIDEAFRNDAGERDLSGCPTP